MSEFDDFFSQVNPESNGEELPRLPSNALTQPLESVVPFEMFYPKTIQYAGAFAIDNATKSLVVNMRAKLSGEDFQPTSLQGRLSTLRVASIIDGAIVDGFIVDVRDTSAVIDLRTEDVDEINSRSQYSDNFKDMLYRPALAVVFETEEGFPGFNGDVRFLEYGKQLLIAANRKKRDTAARYDEAPSGSYAIFDTDYEFDPESSKKEPSTQSGQPEPWWKRMFK